MVKNMPASARDARDVGSVLRLGRSPGEGNGNLLQYSFLENSMDRGAWRAKVHGVLKSWTQLRDWVQCSLTVSSSATLFSSCLQSFPESGYFPMSQLFSSSLSIWASATVLPMNIQGWFPLGLTEEDSSGPLRLQRDHTDNKLQNLDSNSVTMIDSLTRKALAVLGILETQWNR